nr:MAG TPA: hypothetical protein [Caudoviricetes sp.]
MLITRNICMATSRSSSKIKWSYLYGKYVQCFSCLRIHGCNGKLQQSHWCWNAKR